MVSYLYIVTEIYPDQNSESFQQVVSRVMFKKELLIQKSVFCCIHTGNYYDYCYR